MLLNQGTHFSLNDTVYSKVLSKYSNAKDAVFFDLVENSMLDILVCNGTEKSEIRAIYNNQHSDMFFVKANMLTDDKTGSPLRGVTFKAVLTGLNDEKFIVQGADPG